MKVSDQFKRYVSIHSPANFGTICSVLLVDGLLVSDFLMMAHVHRYCHLLCGTFELGLILRGLYIHPYSLQVVADYVHSRGLKLGIYTDRGYLT